MKSSIHKSIKLGQIIGKYLTNSESVKENEILSDWINENSTNRDLLNSISSNKKLIQEYEIMNAFNKKQALERFRDKVLLKAKIKALKRWKVAALVLVLVGVGGLIYSLSNNLTRTENMSTLYTSINTDNGQRSRVMLPDSSIVWLNSGTTLSYPVNFSEDNRKIILEGQAFFQVTHKNKSPFSVQADGLVIRVLGTKFDVSAYPGNNEIAVVLKNGKVELTHQEYETFNYIMKPGEKALYNVTDNTMNVGLIDTDVYLSWIDGELIFRNEPINNVIEKLEKWYDIDVTVSDPEVYNSIFSGTIKNESYEEIFRLIGIACDLNCRMKHNYEKEEKPEIILSKK